jgi:membrane-bound lytic murein transglycosylase D
MDLSSHGPVEVPDIQETGTGENDASLLSPNRDRAVPAEGEIEKVQNGSPQQELKIADKNGQPPDSLKEEENSDQARLYDAIDFCQKSQDLWKANRLEQAKKCLDQAYQSILDVKANGDPEMVQQIDDLRFLISKRILEIYASRFNGVQGNHNEIPLVMNDYVRAEIKRFQMAEKAFFIEAYQRSGRFRPYILEELEDAGLPADLSWLPLIESGFKVRALSRSRALGLWQFIPSTGYKFGLKRNQWIDERMDVEKSTHAAIAYLRELHEIFGDWTTVLAAYNCGEGTVLRGIRRQRINYLDDFWDLYERLPRETARYVPRYLAVLHIIKNPHQYGFELDGTDPPFIYEEVEIDKKVRLSDVARQIGVSEHVLIDLNPELRYKATPENYGLKVPPDKAEALRTNLAKIPRYVPPKKQYAYHRVRRGETLSHIARKYRTSVRAIAKANGIVQKDYIKIGQKLKIPVK